MRPSIEPVIDNQLDAISRVQLPAAAEECTTQRSRGPTRGDTSAILTLLLACMQEAEAAKVKRMTPAARQKYEDRKRKVEHNRQLKKRTVKV